MSAMQDFLARAPQVLRDIITSRIGWAGIDWSKPYDRDDKRVETPLESAEVISSVDPNGGHVIMLDIDKGCWAVPSSTPGRHHLYIDHSLSWDEYEKLLTVLRDVGLIEPGYFDASRARKSTFLRPPWVRKGAELEVHTQTPEALERWLETVPITPGAVRAVVPPRLPGDPF